MAEKLSLVDMIGIGNLLEPLVAEDIITCEERDRIILRIAKDNEIDEYRLSGLRCPLPQDLPALSNRLCKGRSGRTRLRDPYGRENIFTEACLIL